MKTPSSFSRFPLSRVLSVKFSFGNLTSNDHDDEGGGVDDTENDSNGQVREIWEEKTR